MWVSLRVWVLCACVCERERESVCAYSMRRRREFDLLRAHLMLPLGCGIPPLSARGVELTGRASTPNGISLHESRKLTRCNNAC